MSVDAWVSLQAPSIPNYHGLVERLAKTTGDTSYREYPDNPDLRAVSWSHDQMSGGMFKYTSKRPSLLDEYSRRVIEGHIKLEDIYTRRYLSVPSGWNNYGTTPYVQEPADIGSYLGFSLLGIPEESWVAWMDVPSMANYPDYIIRAQRVAAKADLSLKPSDIETLRSVLYNHGDIERTDKPPTLVEINSYIKWLSKTLKQGIDRDMIRRSGRGDIADWWYKDWSPEATARFANLNTSIYDVERIEKQGVRTSDLIIKVLYEGMPIEWARAASDSISPQL